MNTFQDKLDIAILNSNESILNNIKNDIKKYSISIVDLVTQGSLSQYLQKISNHEMKIDLNFSSTKTNMLYHFLNTPAEILQKNDNKKITNHLLTYLPKKIFSDILIILLSQPIKNNLGLKTISLSIGLKILHTKKFKQLKISGHSSTIPGKINNIIMYLLNQNILMNKNKKKQGA